LWYIASMTPALPSCQENSAHNSVQVPTLWYDGKEGEGVCAVERAEFSSIRRYLGKTQSQLAQLLGISPKAVQSFEQGWRKTPVHTERQVLLLVALKNMAVARKNGPCWARRKCPVEIKQNCPAWEFKAGHLCWFINGTICQGRVRESWRKKMKLCRQCKVFRNILPPLR